MSIQLARFDNRKWKCSLKSGEPQIKAAGNICFYLEILRCDLSVKRVIFILGEGGRWLLLMCGDNNRPFWNYF